MTFFGKTFWTWPAIALCRRWQGNATVVHGHFCFSAWNEQFLNLHCFWILLCVCTAFLYCQHHNIIQQIPKPTRPYQRIRHTDCIGETKFSVKSWRVVLHNLRSVVMLKITFPPFLLGFATCIILTLFMCPSSAAPYTVQLADSR